MPDSLSRRLQSARVADGRRSGSATIASAQMVRAMDPSPVCTTSGGAEPHRGARMEPQRAKMFATPMARPRMRMGKISAGSIESGCAGFVCAGAGARREGEGEQGGAQGEVQWGEEGRTIEGQRMPATKPTPSHPPATIPERSQPQIPARAPAAAA
eukprot:scaffold11760_cov108-Isochrysis_galbana.AAC.5